MAALLTSLGRECFDTITYLPDLPKVNQTECLLEMETGVADIFIHLFIKNIYTLSFSSMRATKKANN